MNAEFRKVSYPFFSEKDIAEQCEALLFLQNLGCGAGGTVAASFGDKGAL